MRSRRRASTAARWWSRPSSWGSIIACWWSTATDVTDVVHPDNAEMAVRAVKSIGLDVGGVDFLTRDITVSYKEGGGAICEVNAAPGFRMHVAPSAGTPRDVAGPVMDMLFPP